MFQALISSQSYPTPVAPVGAMTVAYPAPSTAAPADAPTIPQTGMAVWNPTFTGSAPGGSNPQIATAIRQAPRNRVATISGYQFSSDIAFVVYGQTQSFDAALITATRIYRNSDRAAINIPTGLPSTGMYVVWPTNSVGYGNPFCINKTDARWLQSPTTGSNSAIVGDVVTIHGQCLSGPGGNCWVYIQPNGSAGQWVTATVLSQYRVQFTVPSLSAATYQVWVHNGYGGAHGWSLCGQLLVVTTLSALGLDYDQGNYFLSDYAGGGPNTGADTSGAFAAAIAAIGDFGPATIHLQAGVYLINSKLSLLGGLGKGIYIKGAGEGLTTIRVNSGFSTPDYVINCSNQHTKFSDLTIDTDTNSPGDLGIEVISGGAFFENVTIKAATTSDQANPVINVSTSGCVFKNLTVHGSYIYNASGFNNFLFDSCHFYGCHIPSALIVMYGGSQTCITNCTAQDENAGAHVDSLRAAGRFVMFACFHTPNNTYVGDNTINLVNTYNPGSDGEQILFESGGEDGAETETVASATVTGGVTVITRNTSTTDRSGFNAFITAGKGVGQAANIVSCSGADMTLNQQLNLTPDSSSRVNVGYSPIFHVAYNNTHTAGTLANMMWQCFTGGSELIVDSNTINNCLFGVSLWSSTVAVQASNCAMPAFFNLVQNNTITASAFYAIRVVGLGGAESETALCIGNVFRDDTVGQAMSGIVFYETDDGTQCDLNVIDNSSGTNSPIGIAENSNTPSPTSTLIAYASAFSLGSATFSGSKFTSGQSGYAVSNPSSLTTITGYQTLT